jgi:Tfp pilus assembly protein PilF
MILHRKTPNNPVAEASRSTSCSHRSQRDKPFLELQGDLEGARDHFKRALAIDEKAFGRNHPDVAIDVHNLGLVLQGQGDLEGARKNFRRALAILRMFFPEDHPQVQTVRRSLETLGK